jgi:hypothetical protein
MAAHSTLWRLNCNGGQSVQGDDKTEDALVARRDTTLLAWGEEDWHGCDG